MGMGGSFQSGCASWLPAGRAGVGLLGHLFCVLHDAVLSQPAMRSNSFPSGSANVVQRKEPLVTSRIRDAPSATSRCDSASKVLLMRSRWSRFFIDFGSGT